MKNKIYKYDFLVIGAGLIGAITALALVKKKFKVLVIDKKNSINKDNRTLAVNANSVDFLKKLDVWKELKTKPQPINKIVIQDNHNTQDLVFEHEKESMGNVIFNKDMHKIAIQKLEKMKILVSGISFDICEVLPNKKLIINKRNYIFKKVVVSVGKNIISNKNHRSVIFDQQHYSHVGFFKHSMNHKDIAYEFFTHEGPLAVLPSPSYNKKTSTFIYSTKEKTNKSKIHKLINEKITKTHGKLTFDSYVYKYPIVPHILKNNKNYIYIGDSLKSIHPVAGQGWNLGVKDIQTLCNLLDQYSIDAKNFNSTYYSRRIVESFVYLGFTSILNFLYENKSSLNNQIIKLGFNSLVNFKFIRGLFIKQAMGRSNLTD